MVPMHFGTFRLGREPMSEPLPRLLSAAERAGLVDRVHPLAEGESFTVQGPSETSALTEEVLSAAR